MDLRTSDISFETSYKQPIGIFDSGVGGLTVLSEIQALLPTENLLYLGDSARSPYGSKSVEKIKSLSFENSLFLSNSGSKVIVIACNTATAVAQDFVESMLGKKVIGVIDAGVRSALVTSNNKKIGIIGTTQTIKSRAHEVAINKIDPSVEVFAKATPLFATLVEEGFVENGSTDLLIEEELTYFKECGVDTLILGCTHYPFLKSKIDAFFENKVLLIDPAKETAKELRDFLISAKLDNSTSQESVTTIFTSDSTETFEISARKLLNDPTFSANVVSVDSFEEYRLEHEKYLATKDESQATEIIVAK